MESILEKLQHNAFQSNRGHLPFLQAAVDGIIINSCPLLKLKMRKLRFTEF